MSAGTHSKLFHTLVKQLTVEGNSNGDAVIDAVIDCQINLGNASILQCVDRLAY